MQRRRSARDGARAAASPAATLTFGTAAGATVRAARRRGSRHRRHARARRRRRPASASIETPLLGRGNLSNVLAATAVALEFGVPLDDIVAAAARLQPADRRGAVRRLRDGITLIDDSYNSSPAALRRALEVVAHETRRHAQGRGARRDARARRPRARRCTRSAAAPPRPPACDLLFAVGGAPARALADAAVAAGMPASAVSLLRERATRPRRSSRRRCAPATSCWSRDRAARAPTSWPIGSRRSSPDALLPAAAARDVAPYLGVLNVTRYITFRTAAASLTALAISLVLGPWMIRKLRDFQIGQVIRQEGPAVAPRQGRDADDGRPADPDGGARADAAVGRPVEPVHLDRGAGDRRLRRGRLRRRLPEDRRGARITACIPRYKMGGQILVAPRRRRRACWCSRSRTRRSTTRG